MIAAEMVKDVFMDIIIRSNKMEKTLVKLVCWKYEIYVGGEFERKTDFIGFMRVLYNYGDFFQFTPEEQETYLVNLFMEHKCYVDMNIEVRKYNG